MVTIAHADAGSHVDWAGFVEDIPVFITAEGTAISVAGSEARIQLHHGLSACAADGFGSVVTGGEDGCLRRYSPKAGIRDIGDTGSGKWITALATGPTGHVAAATGRQVHVFSQAGKLRELEAERSVEALAFAPKGMRLAMARYNGVDLVWLNTTAAPVFLEWKGAHIAVSFSPDGRYVVTSMQENALHGWRLSDAKHMRMTGYPAKVKSVSWSSKGKWLASTGAPAAIVWPFQGKDGPMGKAPKELGAMGQVMAICVACHPQEDVVAIGYANGMISAVRIGDGVEAVLRRAGDGAITALGWDAGGTRLAFGGAGGDAGIVSLG